MSVPSAVPRTAPIAIAPKPPRFPPSRQGSIHDHSYRGFRTNSIDSPGSDSPSGHSTPPCDACVHRRLDCVMSDEDDSCVSCHLSGTDCSLTESPPLRKRKLNGDADDGFNKRR